MKTIEQFFIHWKTSLAGILAAAANSYANGVSGKQVAISLGIAFLGLFSSDSGAPKA